MGKYLSFFKEPQGMFQVRKNTTIFIRYNNAKFYLDAHNTNINNMISDLKLLDNHVGSLRGCLNTAESYYLNREGRMIMEELERFIISWKSNNLTYYRALVDVLNRNKQVDANFAVLSQRAINQIK